MYPAIYNGTTAWADATTPLPPTVNPQQVFDRLFAGATTPAAAKNTDTMAALAQRTMPRSVIRP